MGLLGKALAALSSPIGIAVAAVAGVTAAVVTLWNTSESFRNGVKTIWSQVVASFRQLQESVSGLLSKIDLDFSSVTSVIKNVWTQLCNALGPLIQGALQAVSSTISSVFDAIRGILMTFSGLFTGDWKKMWEGMKTVASSVLDGMKGIISAAWSTIGTYTSAAMQGLDGSIKTAWTGISSAISGVMGSIRTVITGGFSAAKGTISTIFTSIRTTISTVMQACKNTVSTAIEAIKNKFKFTWSLPKIKLPHITITGSFSLSPPSVPHFSISWYKKAMEDGMILNSPTIFGQSGSTLLAGGEAGSEAVVGTQSLMEMIQRAVDSMAGGTTVNYGGITMNIYQRENEDMRALADEIEYRITSNLSRRRVAVGTI